MSRSIVEAENKRTPDFRGTVMTDAKEINIILHTIAEIRESNSKYQ